MMLVVLGLLGVFAVVATRLIHTTLGLYREAGRVEDEAQWVDAAVRQLRRDVWSAGEVTLQGTQAVTVSTGGTGAVEWRVDPQGALVRSALVRSAPGGGDGAGATRRWPEVGGRLTFAWDGVALTVRGADRGADRAGGIRMVSQMKLAEAGGAK
jgi:hypothetical protein